METSTAWRKWVSVFSVFLLSFVAPVKGQVAAATETSVTDLVHEASAPELFQRIVILGASVSDGFTTAEPFGGPRSALYRLENFIEAALPLRHEPIKTHAHRFLFLEPINTMKNQVATTLVAKPSLVVALDALFWFCYGDKLNAEDRMKRFDLGLKLLGQINAPMVVGDLPDASPAVGKILSKTQVPELSTIAECNERLRAWAAARTNVTIFPLSELMKKASADDELSMSGVFWAAGQTRALLQSDGLHPSRHGLAALAIAALIDAAKASDLPLEGSGVITDLEKVYQTGTAIGEARRAEKQKANTPPKTPGQ